MATIFPHADFDEIPGRDGARSMARHDIVCLHTLVVDFDDINETYHRTGYGGLGPHFGVRADGGIKQWRDLDLRAQANKQGNHRVISIETADTGSPFPDWDHNGSDVPAWTDRQLDAIVDLVSWLCDRFAIPKVLVPDSRPERRGVAYHRQGIVGNFAPPFTGIVDGGERWSDADGKVCPGDRRIRQLVDVIVPRLTGAADLFPALSGDQELEILRLARKLDQRSVATFPEISGDGRLREVVVAGRAMLGVSDEVAPGRDARPHLKGIVRGAFLDGIRRPSADRPDRGALRGPLKGLFRDVLDEDGPDESQPDGDG